MGASILDDFHPAVTSWFRRSFAAPTPAQESGWGAIASGTPALIAAPTGSGKTLAAFLSVIDALVREALAGGGALPDETRVIYVSPLKALSHDIDLNLQAPLSGIKEELTRLGLPEVELRTALRTGDTTTSARAAMLRKPPHILVTTPESLYILLTSARGRPVLSTARTVIVDEIHALVGDKRGAHLGLTLERLAALVRERTGAPPLRIGLSATQRPIERVAEFLMGGACMSHKTADRAAAEKTHAGCRIVDEGHQRALDLALELPASPLEAVMAGEVWEELYGRLAALIAAHRTTLIFVNTRRTAERLSRHLGDRVGAELVAAHHGSLAKDKRLRCEQRLKRGELRALVATASLELGIDIGAVDLVCQIGSTRSIATFLQRVGRSGHSVGGLPRGRLFPTSRDELVECVALLDSVRRGELDLLEMPSKPLDILAQQIVAATASGPGTPEGDPPGWSEEELFALCRAAYSYRELTREEFDAVIAMLADGFSTVRGRRGALLHRDAVNRRLRPRRGARHSAIQSGGAIPDTADYEVVLEPGGAVVGSVHEDFAVESMQGDVFQLGNTSWRVLKVESGRLRVADAGGESPTIPFWLGEAPGRTRELSIAVSRLRGELGPRLAEGVDAATRWLCEEVGVDESAATQLCEYLAAGQAALGAMPTRERLVLERFFDESGGMQLVIHSSYGSRINRAFGLSLRKRFCRKFNFELQAAATDDAIVISLGEVHSFPLEEVYAYLRTDGLRDLLIQALLDAPMFEIRWRWNASRSLAVARRHHGKKVPAPLQRMRADDLAAVCFPDAGACLENIRGAREVPDHPLVNQTIDDCLTEAMDFDGFHELIGKIERGELDLRTADLSEPSPLAHEILNARPYAFLDDAPLEERRTQAVRTRRLLTPQDAAGLGALDADAIARVRAQAWPEADTPDELHDGLVSLGYMTAAEGAAGSTRAGGPWRELLDALARERRAAVATLTSGATVWIAAERVRQLEAVHAALPRTPAIEAPPGDTRVWTDDEALVELVRGRLSGLGPTTAGTLARELEVAPSRIDAALYALESEGYALRGRFTPAAPGGEAPGEEWCERGLLARIHRQTLQRLRSEIEPVTVAEFMHFLARWHGLWGERDEAEGADALAEVLGRLEGFEAPAAAWEQELLPARMHRYSRAWLDELCLSGQIAWGRLGADGRRRTSGPVRTTPVALLARERVPLWRAPPVEVAGEEEDPLSADARAVHEALERGGASFFPELVAATGLLRTRVEQALGELVAAGLLNSDGFSGLRALITPASRREPASRAGRARRRAAASGLGPLARAGRWSLLPRDAAPIDEETRAEAIAWVLLRRYGVVFRRLLTRERAAPPWRSLVRALRRLEARGEVRGGRFVHGGLVSGEQYALPEAVGLLRRVRRDLRDEDDKAGARAALISVCAADPINLLGIITPGSRLPATLGNRLLLRAGVPVAVLEGGEVRHLDASTPEQAWAASNALLRRGDVSARVAH